MNNPIFVKFCSTDGNLLLNLRDISSILEDPAFPGTCMVKTMLNDSYEVSGSLEEITTTIIRVLEKL